MKILTKPIKKKLPSSDSHWKKNIFLLEKKFFPLVKKYSTNNGIGVIAITDNLTKII